MSTLERVRNAIQVIQMQRSLIRAQKMLINSKNREIERLHLNHAREMQGIVCAWLISIERPEVDLRDDLAEMDVKLAHTIAQLEEHVL